MLSRVRWNKPSLKAFDVCIFPTIVGKGRMPKAKDETDINPLFKVLRRGIISPILARLCLIIAAG